MLVISGKDISFQTGAKLKGSIARLNAVLKRVLVLGRGCIVFKLSSKLKDSI